MATIEQLSKKAESLEPPSGAANIENYVQGIPITRPAPPWMVSAFMHHMSTPSLNQEESAERERLKNI